MTGFLFLYIGLEATEKFLTKIGVLKFQNELDNLKSCFEKYRKFLIKLNTPYIKAHLKEETIESFVTMVARETKQRIKNKNTGERTYIEEQGYKFKNEIILATAFIHSSYLIPRPPTQEMIPSSKVS